jgi:two-component system, response regulator YesN
MLRMIVADDEFIVRDGLINLISWKDFGIEVVAEACDGLEAYELCIAMKPDILLTDIRMPIMDGLEVASKLKAEDNKIKIIMISGIQDFNYVKTALNIDAEGYILKPIKINEISEVFSKVVEIIENEKNRENSLSTLKQQLEESKPVIKEIFLRSLLLGEFSNECEILQKLEEYSIPLDINESFLMAVIKPDNLSKTSWYTTKENKELLKFAINNIISDVLIKNSFGISFCNDEFEFVLLFNGAHKNNDQYYQCCREILNNITSLLKISAAIGVSNRFYSLVSIGENYNDAVSALHYRFFIGKNSIISIKDVSSILVDSTNKNNKLMHSKLYDIETSIIKSVKSGNFNAIETSIMDFFKILSSSKSSPVDHIQSLCTELLLMAFRAIYDLDDSINIILPQRYEIINNIFKSIDIFDLKDYLLSIFKKITDHINNKHDQKNAPLVKNIKDIINKKYMENLSVAKISEEVYLTPNYISLIFKQETGETITEYITKVRIDVAQTLLKTTNLKVFEIAELVGYDQPHYFSTVFKKYTGMHANKYRSLSSLQTED